MIRRLQRSVLAWRRRPGIPVLVLATVAAMLTALLAPASARAATVTYRELYRPQFHFTPAQNWMNDPNGMVYYKGEYHLFFQHNPSGTTWGNISWGHAVSRDLVHWRQLGVAIPDDAQNYIFSGSAVIDWQNTSGFGTPGNPPMVAIYTQAAKNCCHQSQAIAYSLDRGRTFTKYAGNPVIDLGLADFRDPKVFWYEPAKRWLMTVVLSADHKVSFYSSPNLKTWTHLSDFGPANATGGVWECPDLFPLAVDGNPRNVKWVLVVNINPGGIAGGSGGQYFVGRFDGTTFTPDPDSIAGSYTPPAGTLFQGFEGSDFGAWTADGSAFGSGPAAGALPGQGPVTGFVGSGLANSFHGYDSAFGTLTSPAFTVTEPYINLLVGGGNHPHQAGMVDTPPPPGTVFADFEGSTYGTGWTATGTFAGTTPPTGTIGDQQPVSGYEGNQLVNTFIDHDNGTGHIMSPTFTITSNFINLLVGGGNHPYPGAADNPPTAVDLVVDGQVVRTATGQDSELLNWVAWDTSALVGRTASIDIVDESTGGWGHILADQITFANSPALPRSVETAANLLVDGAVVRSVTGRNSEHLDWAAMNVREFAGRTAQLQLVDRNNGGWGHLLADQIVFADAPARSVEERSNWLDYGKDYYAAVSWNGLPDGRRVMLGWMSNWNYASSTPTSPWRSAMSVPRETALRTLDGKVRLVTRPIAELSELRGESTFRARDLPLQTGTTPLRQASGKALDIRARFAVGHGAGTFGLHVRTGNGQQTVIGYDPAAGELYVDRTQAGVSDFSTDFPSVQRAPLTLTDGRLDLRILVDWSSVEVFADGGRRVITDQIFPDDSSRGVALFATTGGVRLNSIDVAPMRSAWGTGNA